MKDVLSQIDDFTRGYLVCALWASNDESTPAGGKPLDETCNLNDFAPDALEKLKADCQKFQADNAELLTKAYELYDVTDGTTAQDYAGHDFWLTRNGHGAGFWDRGFGKLGDTLTKACKQFGEIHLYKYRRKVYVM